MRHTSLHLSPPKHHQAATRLLYRIAMVVVCGLAWGHSIAAWAAPLQQNNQANPTPKSTSPASAWLGDQDHFLTPGRISLLQPASWLEWVEDLGGVWMHQQYVGTGGWALRGGFGSQIAVRFDGVPLLGALEDQTPSRQLLTLDPRSIGHLQLVRGPASYQWGNHAFAGGIALRSAAIPLATEDQQVRFSGIARGSYQSADQAPEGHLTLGLSGRGGGLLLAGGGGVHDLLHTGGDTGSIGQSNHNRAHALGKFQWQWHNTKLSALYLFGQVDDIKYVSLFFPQSDVWRFRERRHLAYISVDQKLPRGKLKLLLAYQFLDTYEIAQDIALGTRRLEASRSRNLPRHLLSALGQGQHQFGPVRLDYQIEWTWQQMQVETLEQSGQPLLLAHPYPLEGERHTLAASVGMHIDLLDGPIRLALHTGARFDPHWDTLEPANGFARFARLLMPWAIRGGLQLAQDRKLWMLQLWYATGYRVPSWQEQAGAGPQGQAYWLPNAQLQAELNHSIEARWTMRWRRRIYWQLRSFVQVWQDLLGLRRSTHEGQAQISAVPVLQHTNHNELLPTVGIESMIWVRIWRGWSAKASIAWLHLFDAALTTTPLLLWPTAPPLSGRMSTRYQFGQWGGIEAALAVMAGQATRLAPITLQLLLEQRSPRYTPWTTLTIRANLRITRHLQLVANLDNLSHQAYLRYGSTIFAPGINYRFQLVGQW